MVHGDCSSRGCYAMTDEQIAEIYSLGREFFFGGQRAFQLQAYPFKMTPVNMAKHRNNPNMPFWRMIKQGYDHFEVTKQEPKVDFCEKKYVFDASKAPNATRDPVFDASAKCPAYAIPEEVADAVREKQQTEAAETARLISKGTPVARLNTGIDGGMHRVFAARVPEASTGLSEGGDSQGLARSRWPARPAPSPPTSIRRGALRQSPARCAAGAEACGSAGPRPPPAADAGRQRCAGAHNPTGGSPASPARSASAARRHAPQAPAAPAKPKVIEAKRTSGAAPEAAVPKSAAQSPNPSRPRPAPPLKPSVTDTAGGRRARTPRSPARRRSSRRTHSTAASGR